MGILVWKDVLTDLRRKEHLLAMFLFAALTLLMFHFALDADEEPRYHITQRVIARAEGAGIASVLSPLVGRSFDSRAALLDTLATIPLSQLSAEQRAKVVAYAKQSAVDEATPGLIWVAFVFAGVLGLAKGAMQEREQGGLEGLLLTPVPRGVIYIGKMLGNAVFLTVVLGLILPLTGILLGVDLGANVGAVAVVALGGVLGFSAVGTLLGGVTAHVTGREVLLPILLFPLLVPLLLVEVHLTQAILSGEPLATQTPWVRMLVAFDGIFLVVSYLVFDAVMES
jgi:heme exporter protein B